MAGLKHRPLCFRRFDVLFPMRLRRSEGRRRRVEHGLQLRDFRSQLFTLGGLLRSGQLKHRFARVRSVRRAIDVIVLAGKERQEAVVILLGKGIKLVVMAFGASRGCFRAKRWRWC